VYMRHPHAASAPPALGVHHAYAAIERCVTL
jgi:hypothetical protein